MPTKGERKKAKWTKLREKNAAIRQEAIDEYVARASRKKKKYALAFQELKPRPEKFYHSEGMKKAAALPSHTKGGEGGLGRDTRPLRYEDPELAAREAKAREESDRKKKQVAPLYSKGPYQFIGDAPPEITKNLGKKV